MCEIVVPCGTQLLERMIYFKIIKDRDLSQSVFCSVAVDFTLAFISVIENRNVQRVIVKSNADVCTEKTTSLSCPSSFFFFFLFWRTEQINPRHVADLIYEDRSALEASFIPLSKSLLNIYHVSKK